MAVQSRADAPADALPARAAADARRVDSALHELLGAAASGARGEPLPRGLTNEIYKVDLADGTAAVLRIPGKSDNALGIDRAAELHNARVAAAAGAAPQVVAGSAAGTSLVRWIEGHTLESRDLDDSAMLSRVAALCRRLHAAPAFRGDFDMFTVQQRYLRVVRERGFAAPVDYLDHMPSVERIHAALQVAPPSPVPCHNDLLAANILDDGRVWFIDWEYSGNNDPAFELGNLWSEADLPDGRLGELVAGYHGADNARATARARLFAAVAQYGWTLWGCIQQAVSDVDFDFGEWARHRYDRAVALFRSPALPSLLDTAAQIAR